MYDDVAAMDEDFVMIPRLNRHMHQDDCISYNFSFRTLMSYHAMYQYHTG